MFPIYEVSAAPHFPQPSKAAILNPTRPEALASVMTFASLGSSDLEVSLRNGEIYVALSAAF